MLSYLLLLSSSSLLSLLFMFTLPKIRRYGTSIYSPKYYNLFLYMAINLSTTIGIKRERYILFSLITNSSTIQT